MKKNIYVLVPAAAAFMLTGCSKFGNFTSDMFNVTPTPLEYVGGEVPATVSANIPSKVFPKKGIVTCTPVLRYNGGEATSAGKTFQGEKIQGNNTVISYKNGGASTMKISFPWADGMESSELYMTFAATKGGKSVELNDVKIDWGVQCTATLVKDAVKSGNSGEAADQFQRIIAQKQEAQIKFLIGQANLRGSELNSSNIKDFIAKLKNIKDDEKGLKLNNVEVSSYASPDGAYSLNENLANNRGKNSESYVNQQLKKQKLSGNVDTKYTAEDWEGFKTLVQQSNLQDKDVVLRVLSMYSDPEQREQEIKNLSSVYKELADAVLPELRRSRLTINYDVIGRSDDEILAQFNDDASKLSVEELLYAANKLTTDAAKKEAILKKTTELYPKDYRAYNNLGNLAYKKGDVTTASNFYKKALSVNSKAAEPNVNLGLIALQNGDAKTAESYIAKGSASNNYDEALGDLYIAQGKYKQATAKLAESYTNSAALASIMNKDYAKAKVVLNSIKNPDATTYYLSAVLAARTNSKSELASNLKKAISLNSAYAKKAATDAEFNKYASEIASIVK